MATHTTARGRETRERILAAALDLFQARGVSATSVDEILAAAAAGKGQFYRYFESKEALVSAVVDRRIHEYLGPQRRALERLESWKELESHLHGLVAAHEGRDLLGGCPVGSLALGLSGQDESFRRRLADAMTGWQESLAVGLERLTARGQLAADVVPERAAGALLATIQGAYLLATVRRESGVMRDAITAALVPLRPPGASA